MTQKPASQPLDDSEHRLEDDVSEEAAIEEGAVEEEISPSASARFRLKMDAFGRLLPEVVPIDEAGKPTAKRPRSA